DPIVARLGDTRTDVVAGLGPAERNRPVRRDAAVRQAYDACLRNSPRQRVPPRKRQRLMVVVVDVDSAAVRPALVEQGGDLGLEATCPQGTVLRVVVDEQSELRGRPHDDGPGEDAGASRAD